MDYSNCTNSELLELLKIKDEKIKHMESTFASSFSQSFKDKEKSNFGHSIDWLKHSPVCTKIVDLDFNLQYMSRAGIEGLQICDVSEYYGRPYPFHFFPEPFKVKMNKALEKVKEINGELKLNSELNRGSSFEIKFPLEQTSSVPEEVEASNNTEIKKYQGRALVVDDEEFVRELISEMLQSLGIQTEEAADGKEALEKVKTNSFDYIFTDLVMPNLRGEEFLVEAKKIVDSKTNFFIISGLNQNKHLSSSDDVFIRKPFNIEDIINALSTCKLS